MTENLPSEEELDAVEKQMREFPKFGRPPNDARWMQLGGVEPTTLRAADAISALRARIVELEASDKVWWESNQQLLADNLAANTRAEALQVALKELVACKDLKDRAKAMNPMMRGAPRKVRADMLLDYERRKPLAWSAARALIQERTMPEGHVADGGDLDWTP